MSAAGVMPGAISLRYGGADDVERLDVAGEIAFGEGATITVTADSTSTVEAGEWTIVSAGSITGDLPELTTVNFGRKIVRLRRAGSEIRLVVTKPGLSLLVR